MLSMFLSGLEYLKAVMRTSLCRTQSLQDQALIGGDPRLLPLQELHFLLYPDWSECTGQLHQCVCVDLYMYLCACAFCVCVCVCFMDLYMVFCRVLVLCWSLATFCCCNALWEDRSSNNHCSLREVFWGSGQRSEVRHNTDSQYINGIYI